MNEAASYTNSPAGLALKAQENSEIQAGDLAGKAADAYASTLVTIGNELRPHRFRLGSPEDFGWAPAG